MIQFDEQIFADGWCNHQLGVYTLGIQSPSENGNGT